MKEIEKSKTFFNVIPILVFTCFFTASKMIAAPKRNFI